MNKTIIKAKTTPQTRLIDAIRELLSESPNRDSLAQWVATVIDVVGDDLLANQPKAVGIPPLPESAFVAPAHIGAAQKAKATREKNRTAKAKAKALHHSMMTRKGAISPFE